MGRTQYKLVSIKRQLSVWFVGLYSMIIFIAVIFWLLSINDYQDATNSDYEEKLELYVNNVNQNIQQTNSVIMNMVVTNKSFTTLGLEENELKEYLTTYQLINDIDLFLATQRNVDGIFVFYENYRKQVYKISDNLSYTDMRQLLNNNLFMIENNANNTNHAIQQIGENCYYSFYYIRNGKAVLGLSDIGLDLHGWKIKEVIKDIIVVSGDQLKVDLSEDNLEILKQGRNIVGDNVIYLKASTVGDLKFAYVKKNSMDLYLKVQHIIVFACLVLSLYPAYRIYCLLKKQFLEPLAELTNVMETLQKGDWEVQFVNKTRLEEIENIKKTFIVMIGEIKNLKIQKYEEQNSKQVAKLQYLQLQLNPHFYINCLKLIQARLQLGDTQIIEDFLIELAFHFRYLMKKGMVLVTVAEEIKFVENFYRLSKELWTRDVNLTIQIDDEALDKMLPILAVQTFVENSIKYAKKDGQNTLTITIYVQYMDVGEGQFINIIVRDDGTGYPEAMLPLLNSEEVDNKKIGIGITNLKKRITLLYDHNYNWYFYNQGGAVSEILLAFPKEQEE